MIEDKKHSAIVRALLNCYGVTRLRCNQCTICGRSPCSDSKIPWLYVT